MTTGLIDVHSHLLPGIDDGCKTIEESIACAQMLVDAGYTHSFCTPHVWPSLSQNNSHEIPRRVNELQKHLDHAGIALKLMPGGELNLGVHLLDSDFAVQPTYGMNGKYLLIDLWCDALPGYFGSIIRSFQVLGRTIILAHPERMRAVQDSPELAETFASNGVLLQGNLGCFSDPPHADNRRTAEILLRENRYFMVGSDLHNPQSLPSRLEGLNVIRDLAGQETLDRLTKSNPMQLLA